MVSDWLSYEKLLKSETDQWFGVLRGDGSYQEKDQGWNVHARRQEKLVSLDCLYILRIRDSSGLQKEIARVV